MWLSLVIQVVLVSSHHHPTLYVPSQASLLVSYLFHPPSPNCHCLCLSIFTFLPPPQGITVDTMESLMGSQIPAKFLEVDEVGGGQWVERSRLRAVD